MSKMNCKRLTRMMSIYVAGNLVGEPERAAVAHLAACKACRQLAEEFSESTSLLTQACSPPEFGAEFYTGIRSAVLGKITAERSKPSIFGRRWVYAASLAAVVVAAVALQLFRGTPRQPSREIGFTPQVTGQPELGRAKGSESSSPLKLAGSPRESHPAIAKTRPSRELFTSRASRRSNTQIQGPRGPDGLETSVAARDNRKEIAPVIRESVALSGPSAPSPSRAASSTEVSRIEIQTADPNIRIIWLAPRDSRKSEETNHDQDPQNGYRN